MMIIDKTKLCINWMNTITPHFDKHEKNVITLNLAKQNDFVIVSVRNSILLFYLILNNNIIYYIVF